MPTQSICALMGDGEITKRCSFRAVRQYADMLQWYLPGPVQLIIDRKCDPIERTNIAEIRAEWAQITRHAALDKPRCFLY